MINNLAGGIATGMRKMTRSPSKPVGTIWPMRAGDIMPGHWETLQTVFLWNGLV